MILGFAVFLYVLLDGFDLGVGILYGFAPESSHRPMMSSIAPVWDGNETWLILGGVGLLAAFPLAFAIIIPAVYFPMLAMLLGLVFRGVAFEFQFKQPRSRRFWSLGFCVGSGLVAFSQGAVLGTLVQGIDVSGRNFGGGSFDWLSPFSAVTGVAVMLGYALLGACWLIIKAEGDLESWAREKAGFVSGVWCWESQLSVSGHRCRTPPSRHDGSPGLHQRSWRQSRWRHLASRWSGGAPSTEAARWDRSPLRSACLRCHTSGLQ